MKLALTPPSCFGWNSHTQTYMYILTGKDLITNMNGGIFFHGPAFKYFLFSPTPPRSAKNRNVRRRFFRWL